MKSKYRSSSSSFESISTSFSSTLPKYPSFRSSRSFLSEDSKGSGHFLDFCHLCKCYIGSRHDIFMYMGDIPFCSEECRQEQIDMDEAKEKKTKIVQNQQQLSTNPSPEKIYVRVTDAVVAS